MEPMPGPTYVLDRTVPSAAHVPQLDASFRIVVVNNRGGRIFDRVASLARMDKTFIINAHDFSFEHWAAMWRIDNRVTELRPDADATRHAWERYDALW